MLVTDDHTTTPAEKQRQALFNTSLARIGKIWPDRANARLDKDHQEAAIRIELTQDALNSTWLACQADKADLTQFKAALSDWESERKAAAELLAKEKHAQPKS